LQDGTQRAEYVRSLSVTMVQGCYSSEVMSMLNPAYRASCPDPPVARIEGSLEEKAFSCGVIPRYNPFVPETHRRWVSKCKNIFRPTSRFGLQDEAILSYALAT
jgi:hypothetical protein